MKEPLIVADEHRLNLEKLEALRDDLKVGLKQIQTEKVREFDKYTLQDIKKRGRAQIISSITHFASPRLCVIFSENYSAKICEICG